MPRGYINSDDPGFVWIVIFMFLGVGITFIFLAIERRSNIGVCIGAFLAAMGIYYAIRWLKLK